MHNLNPYLAATLTSERHRQAAAANRHRRQTDEPTRPPEHLSDRASPQRVRLLSALLLHSHREGNA